MAAVDYFIRFDGIKGESTDAKHTDEIDVESWSWGASNPGATRAGAGARAGKATMEDFQFAARLNRASPSLMRACATGQHIKTATLSARKAGKQQQDFLTFTFHDVFVTAYQTGGVEAADVVPTDQVSFSFGKIEVEYRQQKADGSFTTTGQFRFDLKTNKTF